MPENGPDEDWDDALLSLEQELGSLFSMVRRMYLEHAALLAPGVSPGAYKVFTMIAARERMRPSELSEKLMSDRSQVSRMLRELEAHDLIERVQDPDDGRSSFIIATQEGKRRLDAARLADRQRLRSGLTDWPVDEIRSLTRLLRALSQGDRP